MQNANNYDELLERATQAVLDQAPQDLPPTEMISATKAMAEQLDSNPQRADEGNQRPPRV